MAAACRGVDEVDGLSRTLTTPQLTDMRGDSFGEAGKVVAALKHGDETAGAVCLSRLQ
jgi:hypothetical protein